MKNSIKNEYDALIIGAGHNGLVAASYLSRTGLRVLVIEKNDYIGGATTSQRIFPDYDAYLSRYSYLISLFPQKISVDLGLTLDLKRRKVASFTPYEQNGSHNGLLISNESEAATIASIEALSGNKKEYKGYQTLLAMQKLFAAKVWDSMLQPLQGKEVLERLFVTEDEKLVWKALVEEPLGKLIERHLQNDLLRGVLFTDAKIGAFTHPDDQSLLQNRTFLYHVIGNKTGEWRVPTGGMQSLVEVLKAYALKNGVTILIGTEANQLVRGKKKSTVYFTHEARQYEVKANYVLVNAAPPVLARLLGEAYVSDMEDEGSVFKMNMLLKKLPELKYSIVTPVETFTGTFHMNQNYEQMKQSYQQAKAGQLPELLPAEIYCHTLTDSSILAPDLAKKGYHTLTLFGLDVPYSLFEKEPERVKKEAVKRYIEGINSYLAEPLEECLAADIGGNVCIEAKSPVDIEKELTMPRGNIFHNALSWFYASKPEEIGAWGVETGYERIYLCGSGAKRGGAVSGIPGYNAAMKVLGDMKALI